MADRATQRMPEPGAIVGGGRFVIHELLGEGGAARVYRADDRELGRQVALKLLLPRYLGRPEREQRLILEAAFLGRIGRSAHVVELVEGGRLDDLDGWPFVATELLLGTTLTRQKLFERSRALPLRRVCLFARQIAEGVRACHRAGVVHRDVTPANLMVLPDETIEEGNRLVLFDFSHAAWAEGPRVPAGHPDRLTREHEVPGTPKHMSPEQARVEPATPAMDVYAFGVVLWELVTGENPFGHVRERQEFIDMQRQGLLESPRMMGWTYEIPDSLAELVNACLERSPEQRPDMNGVVRQIDRLLESLQVRPPVESTISMTVPVPVVAEVADVLGAWGSPPPGSIADDDEPTKLRELASATNDEDEPTERRDLAAPTANEDEPTERRDIASLISAAGEATERRDPESGVEAPTERRHFVPPKRPAFARADAAMRSPALPVQDVASEPPADPQPADPGPISSSPRWWVVPLVLVLMLVLGSIAWIAGDDRSSPEASDETNELDRAPELVTEPTLVNREPEPVVELEPVVEPEPVVKPKPVVEPEPVSSTGSEPAPEPEPKPEPPPLATTPVHEQPACVQTRSDAAAALKAGQWTRADKLAKQAKCWPDTIARLRIRVQALAQVERYDECVKVGEYLEDKEIKRWVNICRRAQP